MLSIMGMSYIVVTNDNDSNIISGVLFTISLGTYIFCIKNMHIENALFWISATCVGMGTILLTLGILLTQQLILFSVPIFFAGMINLIGGVVIEYI